MGEVVPERGEVGTTEKQGISAKGVQESAQRLLNNYIAKVFLLPFQVFGKRHQE